MLKHKSCDWKDIHFTDVRISAIMQFL